MGKKKRGFTIVEMLVATVLLGLLFYFMYSLLAPGMRAWMKSNKKVEIQQQAIVSVYRLTNELKESHQQSVMIISSPTPAISNLICFASARDSEGILKTKILQYGVGPSFDSGEPDWQKYIIYYLDGEARLRRYETSGFLSYKDPDSMKMLGDPASIISVDDFVTNKIIARKIDKFEIACNPPGEDWKGCVNVTISVYDKDQDFRTTQQTAVGVRYSD